MEKKLAKVIPLFKEPPIQIDKMNDKELEDLFRGLNFNVDFEVGGDETLLEFLEKCMEYAYTEVVDDSKVVVIPVEDVDTLVEGVTEASEVLHRYRMALEKIVGSSELKNNSDVIAIAKKALDGN